MIKLYFMKSIILLAFLLLSPVYAQQAQTSPDSARVQSDQAATLARVDSLLQSLATQTPSSAKGTTRDILDHTGRLVNLLEVILAFFGIIIAVLGFLGFLEIKRIAALRKELKISISRLNKQRKTSKIQLEALKQKTIQDTRQLVQLLYYVSEGDRASDEQRREEAIRWYARAIHLKQAGPEVFVKLGYHYTANGKYHDAIDIYHRALKLDETNIDVLNGLARAYRKDEQLDRATEFYTKALEIDPDFVWSLSGMTQIYLEQGDYQAAFNASKRILRKDKSFFQAMTLGLACEGLGQKEKAHKHFQEALDKIEETDGDKDKTKWIQPYKLVCLLGVHQYDEARAFAQKIVSEGLEGSYRNSLAFRLRVLAAIRDEQEIRELLDYLLKTEPHRSD